MTQRNEYSYALDLLLDLEMHLQEKGIPEEKFEMLVNKAHLLIRKQSNIEELMQIFVKLVELDRI